MNPQAQVSHNNSHNPAHTKGKSTWDDSNNTNNSNHSSGNHHHIYDTKGVSTSDDHILMYDPGGNNTNTRVSSIHDNGDSLSSSSDSAPCTTDTYHILIVAATRPPSWPLMSTLSSISCKMTALSPVSLHHQLTTLLPFFKLTQNAST